MDYILAVTRPVLLGTTRVQDVEPEAAAGWSQQHRGTSGEKSAEPQKSEPVRNIWGNSWRSSSFYMNPCWKGCEGVSPCLSTQSQGALAAVPTLTTWGPRWPDSPPLCLPGTIRSRKRLGASVAAAAPSSPAARPPPAPWRTIWATHSSISHCDYGDVLVCFKCVGSSSYTVSCCATGHVTFESLLFMDERLHSVDPESDPSSRQIADCVMHTRVIMVTIICPGKNSPLAFEVSLSGFFFSYFLSFYLLHFQ